MSEKKVMLHTSGGFESENDMKRAFLWIFQGNNLVYLSRGGEGVLLFLFFPLVAMVLYFSKEESRLMFFGAESVIFKVESDSFTELSNRVISTSVNGIYSKTRI